MTRGGTTKIAKEMSILFRYAKLVTRKLEVNHENASENLYSGNHRHHMVIRYVSFAYWDPICYHS